MPDTPVVSADQLRQFEQEGYLLVKDLLDPVEDLDPVIAEYTDVLDRLARELFVDGVTTSLYSDLPFGQRLIAIIRESGQIYQQYFDFSLPQNGVEADTPFWAGPAVFRMLRNQRLLDAVECFIGPEIYSNPVQHVPSTSTPSTRPPAWSKTASPPGIRTPAWCCRRLMRRTC